MSFLGKILISAVAILVSAYLLPGVIVESFFSALILAFVLSFLNFILKPILIIFTIPLTIMTLGLFLLVINAVLILLADSLVPGFYVDGFWWALIFSLLLSLTNSLLLELSGKKD